MRRFKDEYDGHRDFLVNGNSGTKDEKAKYTETDMGNKKEGSSSSHIPRAKPRLTGQADRQSKM